MPRLAPGSARGEFTISVGAQPSFDADPTRPGDNLGYAAFGRVVEGMDVIHKIFDAPTSPTKTLQGSFKGEVPVTPVKVLTARRVPQ
jgi:peptidyl-prolyl cis-trans isomerase A (cyclophilin A)